MKHARGLGLYLWEGPRMFPKMKSLDEEYVDPWPQCVDPDLYPVPETIDTTPLPFTTEPTSKWPPLDFGSDEAPPIGPLPPEEPLDLGPWTEFLDPAPEPSPWTKFLPDLSFLIDMF